MPDFGRTASDYARHRAGFPPAFFARLQERGALVPGRSALDLGTGTGHLALGLARAGMNVTGLDIASALLDEARRASAAEGLQVRFIEARAESSHLADESFSLITAGQCWHWFDRAQVARECRRLLASGGYLVIAHLDWLVFADNVVEVTERAILEFGARFSSLLDLGREGLYPAWTRDVREAGFVDVETFSFDTEVSYSQSDWRGRIRASHPIGGSLPPADVERFDAFLAGRLAGFPQTLSIPHRVWAVVTRSPHP